MVRLLVVLLVVFEGAMIWRMHVVSERQREELRAYVDNEPRFELRRWHRVPNVAN